ncbi:LuxR C-terminal-related transcriptional regulator [Georgenia ruanii]|uniref:LuxR C-terminal-related transcriptional regulator n=1 Tax=Georgenia ruanii TaxID=348442 RepID=UPI001263FB46|nr:LuxR C-terminal-related transcriptional regulator [Georgenia ruanii]
MTDPRLTIPALPHDAVDRPRLRKLLDEGVEVPLTLVSAPAGTGKTVLAASWAARRPAPTAWVTIDDNDVRDGALWLLVRAALHQHGVDAAGEPPGTGEPESTRLFLTSLATAVASRPTPVTLALDCETALPPDAAAGLELLLRRAAGRLRLLLLTRADPLLPLHRYRLEGSIDEVRMADLAFTTGEARVLLGRAGVNLSAAAMESVMARTRGWAAGLRFAALTLSRSTDQDAAARALTGERGTVADYLLAEVLDTQPPQVRATLLSTSIVDLLRPGLVEVLAGPRAQHDLDRLASDNVFLDEIPEHPGTYRLHPLFRELLRAQLAYEAPERVTALDRVAARWLAINDLPVEAVRHAMAGGAWEDGCRYAVDNLAVARLLTERPPGQLRALLADLPDEADGPHVSLVRAAQTILAHDPSGAACHLERAREVLAGAPAPPSAQLTLALVDGFRARLAGDARAALSALRGAEGLVEQVPDHTQSRDAVALLTWGKGSALLLAGRIDAAVESFTACVDRAGRGGPETGWPVIDSLGQLALIAAMRGRLQRATNLADRSLALRHRAAIPARYGPCAAEIALAWASTEAYDLRAARRHLDRAAEAVTAGDDPLPWAMFAVVTARARRARGDMEGARRVLDEAITTAPLPEWMRDRLRLELAILDIVSGEPARALRVVADVADADLVPEATLVASRARLASGAEVTDLVAIDEGATLATRVDLWLVEASRRLVQGDERAAHRALGRSLRLAAPETLRRPFYEAPADVRRLLRASGDLAGEHGWLSPGAARPSDGKRGERARQGRDARAVPGATRPGSRAPAAPSLDGGGDGPVEPLTPKELEVLGHLAGLLTTEEIAGAMFVSVNTVRTHVRNILRKLTVSRRNEAVRRARALHLIAA